MRTNRRCLLAIERSRSIAAFVPALPLAAASYNSEISFAKFARSQSLISASYPPINDYAKE